jgi:hypothetical protein
MGGNIPDGGKSVRSTGTGPPEPHRRPRRAALVVVALVSLGGCQKSCGSSASKATPTTVGSVRSSTSGGGSGGGGSAVAPGSTPPATTIPPVTTSVAPTTTVPATTTTLLTAPTNGPYSVKQLVTLGHETIGGVVCDVRRGFVVNATTPQVSWAFVFTPAGDGGTGAVGYNYNIPKAGESHAATGSYTLSGPDHDGTRHLVLTVQDHVVFKGFDGNIPNRYSFDLVPGATCPPGG